MKNELLLLNEKHTDTLIEQTRRKSGETLEFKLSQPMDVNSVSHAGFANISI